MHLVGVDRKPTVSTPITLKASSSCPSIATGLMSGWQAIISVPGLATALAAAPILSVMLAVVFGLMTLILMGRGTRI